MTQVDAPARTRRRPVDLTNRATVRAVARRAGLRASPRLGPPFLVDRLVLAAVVGALAPPDAGESVEIGCGIGTLTGELAACAARVVALDLDPACVRATEITQRRRANVTVIRGDALGLDPAELGLGNRWLAAGNLPYHLTGPLLSHLFALPEPPAAGVFLVQREVAARLTADAGGWSLATVALRSLARVERLRDVPPSSFEPPPAVHSSVVRLRPDRALTPDDREQVLAAARAVFQQRRKTLRHGVTHALGGDGAGALRAISEAGVDPGRRPGTLDLDEWRLLAGAMARLRMGAP
jgi:16S rRNA (adenine1518-N6/adenine1519-N6)-dimethyltransferase